MMFKNKYDALFLILLPKNIVVSFSIMFRLSHAVYVRLLKLWMF